MMSSQLPLSSSNNKNKIFQSADHASSILQRLYNFYEKEEYCDTVLVAETDGSKANVHRNVLCASSYYFLTLFRNNLNEAKSDEIKIKEIDGVTLKSIVGFMYTGAIELCSETVESILKAADFFQIKTLITVCCDFMADEVDVSNCLGIAYFAEQYNYTALKKKSFAFACMEFKKVIAEKEFLQLSEEQLIKFISRDDIQVLSEGEVFISLIDWVDYDKTNREGLMFKLLPHVRFTSLTHKFIIDNMRLVCRTAECYDLVSRWLQWHVSPEKRSQLSLENTKPRKTYKKLTFASWSCSDDFKIQTFHPESDSWSFEDLPRPSQTRADFSMCVINKKLIFAGGHISHFLTSSVECLDLETKQWTDLAPMKAARHFPGILGVNGDMYAGGGSDIHMRFLTSMEKYDFETGRWQDLNPLPQQFRWQWLSVVNGMLYALDVDKTMKCYDPIANRWTSNFFPEVKSIIAECRNNLYAFGGSCDDVMEYFPEADEWATIGSLDLSGKCLSRTSFNDRLLTCVQIGDERIINEYNPETNETTILAPPLTVPISDDVRLFTM